MSQLTLRNIDKHFGSFHALRGVDLTIADREFLVLLGASGCGKSTLLRIVAGLEIADQGSVHAGDERIDVLQPRDRRLAMVFQNYAVFPHLTVFDNIGFGLKMQKRPPAEIRQRVEEAAAIVHLEGLLERYSAQLSGGQRQRVALARALVVQPRVMLMDEPLSNLDALLRMEMRAELKAILSRSRTTTIYVTHDQIEAMSLADRIAIMDQGVIVQCDTPMEIYRNPVNTFVAGFIGSPPMNFVDAYAEQDGVYDARGLRLEGPRGHTRLTLGVRPEDLQVAAHGIACQADVVEELGPNVLVTALGKDGPFRAMLPSGMPVAPGSVLYLQPDPARLRWFDLQGRRIST